MNQTTVINKINDLNLQGVKEAYLRQIEDTNYNQFSFEERLYNLLEAQEIFIHNLTPRHLSNKMLKLYKK